MSVWLKALPLKSSGSPICFASAYAKQSPKLKRAGLRPLRKRREAIGHGCWAVSPGENRLQLKHRTSRDQAWRVALDLL